MDDGRARKVARKLPSWAAADAEIPSALSLEQCSSEATARYKAGLAGDAIVSTQRSSPLPPEIADLSEAKAPSGAATECQRDFPEEVEATELPDEVGNAPSIGGSAKRWGFENQRSRIVILDLTGGLGVDSWAFSQVAGKVVYFERSEELAAAAVRNFARLGAGPIEVRCETVTPETELPEADLIYADPARRDAAGRKVFLLEDCTPDILTLLPQMLRKAPAVLLKLSPMADLAMLAGRLSPFLREIHVVELDGEVKELLCLLGREPASLEPEIAVIRLDTLQPGAGDAEAFRFRLQQEREAIPAYADAVRPGDTLLVPSPALLKAGAFNLPCARWGLRKLAPSTHLYLFPSLPGAKTDPSAPGNPISPLPGAKTDPCAPGGLPSEASAWFKTYGIREVLPFGNASFKELKRRYPRAEVTARNLPLSSEELRKKMGISPGGDAHIFACRIADGSTLLLVC
ncbi:MAG: hypothetical protein Q4E27_02860 [Bacteroidales bacterium]|nr:hypothetical protein [Bacteroidales bacterium]